MGGAFFYSNHEEKVAAEHSTSLKLFGNVDVREVTLAFRQSDRISEIFVEEGEIELISRKKFLRGSENKNAGDLPGGYKQRLSMAAALLHKPKILFLDEPTSGIDPLARRDFWRQITDLSAKGTTIIITTHFMEKAEYCDRTMIQDHGKVLALGTPQQIRAQFGSDFSSMNDIFISIVENARS